MLASPKDSIESSFEMISNMPSPDILYFKIVAFQLNYLAILLGSPEQKDSANGSIICVLANRLKVLISTKPLIETVHRTCSMLSDRPTFDNFKLSSLDRLSITLTGQERFVRFVRSLARKNGSYKSLFSFRCSLEGNPSKLFRFDE